MTEELGKCTDVVGQRLPPIFYACIGAPNWQAMPQIPMVIEDDGKCKGNVVQ